MVLWPLVLAVIARRRLGVAWRYFGYGALVFFLFQIASRIPLTTVLAAALRPQLNRSPGLLWTWLAVLVVSAALFEEVGRYAGYRWLMRRQEKTWNKALMYGLGHGGLESILLVAGLTLGNLITLLVLSVVGLDALPAPRRAQVAQLFAAIGAQPGWFPLLGAWERLWALAIQVALSVMVLQVFRHGRIRWLGLAIAAHAVVDGVSVALPQALGAGQVRSSVVVEAIIAIFGITGLWIIRALRDRPLEPLSPADQAVSQPAPAP